MRKAQRPWCCPEPRCTPIYGVQVTETPQPGESFTCLGKMERPVEFSYDGVLHKNDLNHCDYTPLKGLIRWQETIDDWRYLGGLFKEAIRIYESLCPTCGGTGEEAPNVVCPDCR